MTEPPAPPFRAHVPALLVFTAIFLVNFLGRIIPGPLLPVIEQDLGIDHARAGGLFFLISAGYFVTLPCSGFVSARLGHRGTILLSATTLGLALLLAGAGQSLAMLWPALLLMGMAAGLYLPSGVAAITDLVPPRQWGAAMAVHELAPNTSFVLAPFFAMGVVQVLSWRAALVLLGCASLVVAALYRVWGRGGDGTGQAPVPRAVGPLLRERAFWVMVVLFGLGISATLGVYAMLPLYLVTERGMEPGAANTLVALSRIPTIGMALTAGFVTDRVGPRTAIALVFGVAGSMTVLLGVAPQAWVPVAVFLQPMLAVCFFPAGFAMLAAIAPPQSRNVAVSLAVPGGFLLGGGVVPLLIGALADVGMFSGAIVMTGMCIGAGCLVALRLQPGMKR